MARVVPEMKKPTASRHATVIDHEGISREIRAGDVIPSHLRRAYSDETGEQLDEAERKTPAEQSEQADREQTEFESRRGDREGTRAESHRQAGAAAAKETRGGKRREAPTGETQKPGAREGEAPGAPGKPE